MELTVLGSSGAQPAAGDACSGYVLRAAGRTLLFDCGSGVLSNLQRHGSLARLDAVFISHMHPDHFIDLITMRYAIKYGGERGPLDIFLPPGGIERLVNVGRHISDTQPFFASTFRLNEYAPDQPFYMGGLFVKPVEVQHSTPSFAMRIEHEDRVLCYSSDTAPCDGLSRAACGADMLLAENALGGGAPQHEPKNHLTSSDAGRAASVAGAKQLVLTHFWPTASRDRCRKEAASEYGGVIILASPGLRLEI